MTSKYSLQNKWNLFFHNIKDNNWNLDSYQHIYEFNNLEHFWNLYNNYPNYNLGLYFLMKEGVSPIWEDENNEKGGTYSFKINKSIISSAWEEISIRLIGETLTSNHTLITGISLHPKNNCYIIKIWCSSNDFKLYFKNNLKYFNINKSIYKKNIIQQISI